MQQKLWTTQEVEKLKKLLVTMNQPQAAKELGRSRDSVHHKVRQLKNGQYNKASRVKDTPAPAPVQVQKKKYVVPDIPLVELCPVHHCLVSNWADHSARLGCKRPS